MYIIKVGNDLKKKTIPLPLMLYLTFSSFKKKIKSLSLTDIEEGCGEVQDNSILCRASNDAKAITPPSLGWLWDETKNGN